MLALSDEPAEKVEPYVEQLGLSLRVSHGTTVSGQYGVTGIPSSCLIGPDGKVVYAGHPSGVSSSMVESALKGVKARSLDFMALVPDEEAALAHKSIAKSMEQGKLGKALAAALSATADEKLGETEKNAARTLADQIEAHVQMLDKQAEAFAKARDPRKALLVFETLEKEFAGQEIGTAAGVRAGEIKKDDVLSKELDAADAFDKLVKSASKLNSKKAADKYAEFAEKWAGTKAGDRARARAGK